MHLPARPRLLDARDFRVFLRDTYAYEKSRDPAYSYGAFARRAGFANRGHFKLVVDGKRGLTPAMVRKYVRGLGLGPKEAEYFRLLVAFNQAGPAEKPSAQGALRGWRVERDYRKVEQGLLGPEPSLALLLIGMSRLKGFREDAGWIRSRLQMPFPEDRIREALAWLLKRSHLLRRRGRLVRGEPLQVKSGPLGATGLHEAFYRHAAVAGMGDPGHQSHLALLPWTEEEVDEYWEMQLRWFREQLLHRRKPKPGARLYAILGGVFALTKA